ncbi:glycosyltransferase family 2 protein (plasmid) [Paraburkholderia strydomiana]
MPKVSVLLPTFRRNESGKLARAITTVLDQSFTDFELFVVDDGSSDGSAETIQHFCRSDPRVVHVRFEENVGLPALTTAKAFRESHGELIAWMFDDCEWEPNYLHEMVSALDSDSSAGIAYAQCEAHFASGSQIIGEPVDIAKLKMGDNHIPNGATVVRREVFYLIGWYDPRILLVRNNDWDFLQRAVDSVKFLFVPKVLSHEFGVALADSLGNSYDTDFDLVKKITSTNRVAELHPDRVENCDILSIPADISLNEELTETYLRIVIQYVIKGWRQALFPKLASLNVFSSYTDVLSSQPEMLKWWSSAMAKSSYKQIEQKNIYIHQQIDYAEKQHIYINTLHDKINEQSQYIQTQRGIIDEQAAHIQLQLAKLEEREAYIASQLTNSAAQSRLCKKVRNVISRIVRRRAARRSMTSEH